jgi:HK97 family phage portal protein
VTHLGFVSFIKSIVTSKPKGAMPYANTLNAQVPIFRMFGRDIYHSDLVQMCIDRIATEISKLQPKHIRAVNGKEDVVNSQLNMLLEYGPNEIMDTGSFLEKITWLLILNYNAFIYPTWDNSTPNPICTGLYPLNPTMVEFLQDETNTMFVRFTFRNGQNYVVAYDSVIHLRKKFSLNEVMGGDINGQPFNDAILTTLKTDDVIVEGLEKAVKSSLQIRGILKINTMLNGEDQKKERERFEKAIRDSTSGIMAVDLKGEYTPLVIDPKLIDAPTLDAIQQRILNYYGMSVPILNSDYTDAQYEAFYANTIEPIVISLTRNFTRTLFSTRELQVGNKVVFYARNLQYLSTASKIALLQVGGDQGLLTENQKLAILGYPPVEGGERIVQSLNYIDKSLINQYQLGKAKQQTKEGGK